jgi:hypothetical protein
MKALFFVAVLFQFVSFFIAPDVLSQTLEYDTDRPGMDYKNFDLPSPEPVRCANACAGDPQCKAFTYVKPGIQGPNARCWLKTAVPASRQSSCCISGIRADTSAIAPVPMQQELKVITPTAGFESDTDRPGMDYHNFDLSEAQPELCRQACMQELQCKAFTYVKPGVQGPGARCWLKSGVPASVNSSCCISGVKASKEGATPIPIPGPQASPQNSADVKFPAGTSWSVGAYERGIKQPPHKVPWVFLDDGVVEAPGRWEGQWTLIPEGYLVTIQLFATTMGGSGLVVGDDHFLVKFSDDRKEFIVFKYENGKKGLRYRYGMKISP